MSFARSALIEFSGCFQVVVAFLFISVRGQHTLHAQRPHSASSVRSALQVVALQKSQQNIDEGLKTIRSDLSGTDLDEIGASDKNGFDGTSTGGPEDTDPGAAGGNNYHSDATTGSTSNCTKPSGPVIKHQRKRRRGNIGKQPVLDADASDDSDLETPGRAGSAGMCSDQYDTLMAGLAAAMETFDTEMAVWQARLNALDHRSIKQDVQARAQLKVLENEIGELHSCIHLLQVRRCAPEKSCSPHVPVRVCPTRTNQC